jgi:O-antigen ligase
MIFYYLLLLITPFHADPRVGRVLFETGTVIVTPAKIVGLIAVIAAVFSPSPAGAAPRMRSAIPWVFVPFAIVPVIFTLASGLPTPTATISQLISAALLFIPTRQLITTRARMIMVARILVLAFAFSSLWAYKQHFVEHAEQAWAVEIESNYAALMLLLAIPMAFWMSHYGTRPALRRIGLGCALLLIGAVVLTESRAGIIAGAAMGLIWSLRTPRHRFRYLLLIGAAAMFVVVLGPVGLADRFRSIKLAGNPTNGAEESTRIHVELLKAGLAMMEQHPLFGIGLGQFKEVAPKYNPRLFDLSNRSWIAHDTFVQIGSEGGIPVLLLFVAMLGAAWRNFRISQRGDDPVLAGLGLAMELGLIGTCIAALSITAELLPFCIFIFLSPNLHAIAATTGRTRAAAKDAGADPSLTALRIRQRTGTAVSAAG